MPNLETTRHRIDNVKKMLFAILGILLALIFIETALQTGSILFALRSQHRNDVSADGKDDIITVLCLGESTTEDQYPRFLLKALNSHPLNRSYTFKIIDKGHTGTNTDLILGQLNQNLGTYKPDIVITMMGINDGRGDILFIEQKPGPFYTKLKSYKLFRLLQYHIDARYTELRKYFLIRRIKKSAYKHKPSDLHPAGDELLYINQGISLLEMKEYAKAEKCFLKAVNINPLNEQSYLQLAQCYEATDQKRKLEHVLLKLIELNPEYTWHQVSAAYNYYRMNRQDKAIEYFQNALILDPTVNAASKFLMQYYSSINDRERMLDIFNRATIKNYLKHPFDDNQLNSLRPINSSESAVNNINYAQKTVYNYRSLNETLRKRHIKHFCVEYPMRSIEPLKQIVTSDNNAVFVDNELSFKDAVAKHGYGHYFLDNFGSSFGHCTEKGNKLLARNIADAIINDLNRINAK